MITNRLSIIIGLLAGMAVTHANAAEMPMPPADTNPELIVQVGKSKGIALIGTADYDKVAAKLAPMGYKPKKTFGKALMYLTTTINDEFAGCGCPKAFNEFSISYVVEPLNGEGEMSLVPDFFYTNHAQRRASMIGKFGTVENLGDMNHISDEKGVYGFQLRDSAGKLIVEARSGEDLRKPSKVTMADYSLFSLGGTIDGATLPKVFYRLSGPMRLAYDLYSSRNDKLFIAEDSALGQHFKEIEFKPLVWQRAEMREGISWIPNNQKF